MKYKYINTCFLVVTGILTFLCFFFISLNERVVFAFVPDKALNACNQYNVTVPYEAKSSNNSLDEDKEKDGNGNEVLQDQETCK